MNPTFSFILVNFQSAEQLRVALISLKTLAESSGTNEYIIVNNDRAEKELIDQLRILHPNISILHQDRNLGFGEAVNVGARQATGEILFLVNPDTVLMQANFLGLAKAFEFRPTAIYGMALIRSDGRRESWSAGQFPSLWRLLLTNIFPRMFSQPWEATSLTKTDWVSGAACAIRRDFFLSLGGFDSAYFLYFEDVDLARQASDFGAWVGIYPFISFRHTGGGSHKSAKAKKQAYFVSQRLYFKKWRPWLEWGILSLLHKLIRQA